MTSAATLVRRRLSFCAEMDGERWPILIIFESTRAAAAIVCIDEDMYGKSTLIEPLDGKEAMCGSFFVLYQWLRENQ